MAEPPDTRPSLLARIRDASDREAWGQFVAIYAPLVYGLARKRGLQDADAADLTQEVLRAVAGAAGRLDYDPRRGSFRNWLYTVAHHKLYDWRIARRRQCQGTGDSAAQELLDEQPAPQDDSAEWDREYQRRLFLWAAEQVREHFTVSTWQAFWLTAVEGRSGEEAAESLGISAGAVYVAKSRVLARLKKEIERLQVD